MKSKIPSNEWQNSSDYDEAIHLNGGYTLALGYCYLSRLEYLFQQNNRRLFQFRTKWGWCGVNFLFSALRPDNILIINSWANSAMIAKSHNTLFYVWSAILKNILEIKGPHNSSVPTMIIDMPIALHRQYDKENNTRLDSVQALDKRNMYKNKIIDPLLKESTNNIQYIDLLDHFSPTWDMIIENYKDEHNRSPWHISDQVIDTIFHSFIEFSKNSNNYSKTDLIRNLKKL